MIHLVPSFDMDDDYSLPTSSGPTKFSLQEEEDVMELLWRDGQVVMQSQNQRASTATEMAGKKSSQPSNLEDLPAPSPSHREDIGHHQHLFIQEDEMASWLHYPLDDVTSFDELLYPATPCAAATAVIPIPVASPPPPPPPHIPIRTAKPPPIPTSSRAVQNFAHFSRGKATTETSAVRETTVVDSCGTPSAGPSIVRCVGGNANRIASPSSASGANVVTTGETTVTSLSPGGSCASAEPAHDPKPQLVPGAADDRKRKVREPEDNDWQSEDVEFEATDEKKPVRGSSSTKRSRAAEVHNLSERRRRDRINEKMKTLQELIPRCNKTDKASMLDEAIEYLKSLQMQVQMMSMGGSMVPMMYPGVQQYMQPMGMGMGMGVDMSRPMMPFPVHPATAAHLGPRFPLPPFHMQHVPPTAPSPAPDPSRGQAANHPNSMLNPLGTHNVYQPRIPNFANPYQHYHGLQQMQLAPPQNQVQADQARAQSSTSRPSSSGGAAEHLEDHQSG